MTNRSERPGNTDRTGWDQARWNGDARISGSERQPHEDGGALTRFLGGSPGSVLVRLLVVSLVVGALLMWLGIHPWDIFHGVQRFFRRIWFMGFDALREIGAYILAGAAIVIPVWLVLRLLTMRGR